MNTETAERRADRRRYLGYASAVLLLVGSAAFSWLSQPELASGDITGVHPIDVPVIEVRGVAGVETQFVVSTDPGRTQLLTGLRNEGHVPVRLEEVQIATTPGTNAPPRCAWQVEEAYVGQGGDRYTDERIATPIQGTTVAPGETVSMRLLGSYPQGLGCRAGGITYVSTFTVRASVLGRTRDATVPLGFVFAWTDETSGLETMSATVLEPRG